MSKGFLPTRASSTNERRAPFVDLHAARRLLARLSLEREELGSNILWRKPVLGGLHPQYCASRGPAAAYKRNGPEAGAISVPPGRLIATALLARDCAAVGPFDRSGHHAAVLPWADGDAA
jgi:hypothetical protein